MNDHNLVPQKSGTPGHNQHLAAAQEKTRVKRIWTQTLKAISREIEENDPLGNITRIERLARNTWALAKAGDMAAIAHIAERIEGKVAQPQVVQGDVNKPVIHKHVLAFISNI